jgi:hypothetical protein
MFKISHFPEDVPFNAVSQQPEPATHHRPTGRYIWLAYLSQLCKIRRAVAAAAAVGVLLTREL